MIKTCPKCSTSPSQNGYIKCTNDDCDEFNIEYLAHDWQNIHRPRDNEARISAMLFQDPV